MNDYKNMNGLSLKGYLVNFEFELHPSNYMYIIAKVFHFILLTLYVHMHIHDNFKSMFLLVKLIEMFMVMLESSKKISQPRNCENIGLTHLLCYNSSPAHSCFNSMCHLVIF